MLRWVSRVLRSALFLLSVLFLALIPLTLLFINPVVWGIYFYDGAALVPFGRLDQSVPSYPSFGDNSLVPRFWLRSGSILAVQLPLWLLAAVCLAWPVTSFLVAAAEVGAGV